MAFQKIYHRLDGYRIRMEPVLEIDSFDNEAFQWSYIVYHAAPGQEKFDDVTDEHLQRQRYATEQEILECQLAVWEMMRPTGYIVR